MGMIREDAVGSTWSRQSWIWVRMSAMVVDGRERFVGTSSVWLNSVDVVWRSISGGKGNRKVGGGG